MAITGLFIILFLLFHMAGNLKLFLGVQEFDSYAEGLRTLLYPILPERFFLWIFRIVLLAAAVLHIWAAITLTMRNYHTGGRTKYVKRRYMEKSFAARTMIWGGIIIVLFLIFHILQFTDQIITIGYSGTLDSPAQRVVLGFQNWWLVLLYAIAMAAVCLHVWHGFYAAFATLGANIGPGARNVLKTCAWIVAVLLFVGFMVTPIWILFGGKPV